MVRLFNIFRHKIYSHSEGEDRRILNKQRSFAYAQDGNNIIKSRHSEEALATEESQTNKAKNTIPILKAGFSLAEVLVAMLIMSVFYMATAKVMTVKQRHETHENPHGYYECIGNSAPFSVHRVDSTIETIPAGTSETECEFVPISGIPFYNVYVITNQGVYKATESQLNDDDNMVFSGANDLIRYYGRIHENTNAEVNPQNINQIMLQNAQDDLTQLRTFVTTDYPQSTLSGIWGGLSPTQNAVFITW